jgi:hypothetical protein
MHGTWDRRDNSSRDFRHNVALQRLEAGITPPPHNGRCS